MHNEFNAIIEKDGKWFIAYTPEVPGANGQGLTKEECLKSLADAIQLILKDRREDVMRGLPKNAIKEKIIIG
jgi:predicted RNase H-like HicB family nuclease